MFVGNTLLTGGERKAPPRNPCAPTPRVTPKSDGVYEGSNGTKYSLTGSNLTVMLKDGTSITIQAFQNGAGGIRLKDARPNTQQAECLKDPLIIDLDGDRNVDAYKEWKIAA